MDETAVNTNPVVAVLLHGWELTQLSNPVSLTECPLGGWSTKDSLTNGIVFQWTRRVSAMNRFSSDNGKGHESSESASYMVRIRANLFTILVISTSVKAQSHNMTPWLIDVPVRRDDYFWTAVSVAYELSCLCLSLQLLGINCLQKSSLGPLHAKKIVR